MKKFIFLIAIIVACPLFSYAQDKDIKAFKDGLEFLSKGEYERAVEGFQQAEKSLPAIGDYAQMYISKARMEEGRYEKCLSDAKELLDRYKGSRLRKTALNIDIKCSLALDEDGAFTLIERYLNEFPADAEVKYLYAYLIKVKDPVKSKRLFVELYSSGTGAVSERALKELSPPDITAEVFLKKAMCYQKAYNYAESERLLREALIKDEGKLKDDILSGLAQSLFGQKRYKEAALVFSDINDHYGAARSFLRAGETELFKEAIDRMIKDADPDAGKMLISYALEKRDEGEFDDAVKLLSEAGKFPGSAEDALWNTGWLYYINGDYKKAFDVFTGLARDYKTNRYIYWKARALEKTGGNAAHIYGEIRGEDFYGILARGKAPDVSKTGFVVPERRAAAPIERVDLLVEAGLIEEAALELLYLSERASSPEVLVNIARRLAGMELYREAILLSKKLPEAVQPDDALYPIAFWQKTDEISRRFKIDPYLVLSVMREESLFDPMAYSPAGAIGLMQLMPDTASRTARELDTSAVNVYEINKNIELGAGHLGGLMKETGSVYAALAAYNAGAHNARRWLARCRCEEMDEFVEDIPYKETRGYVKRILTSYYKYRKHVDGPGKTGPAAVFQ